MKKTVLIISSVVLNVTFILMFIFLQSDKTDEQSKIDLLKDQLYLAEQKLRKHMLQIFQRLSSMMMIILSTSVFVGKNDKITERFYYDDGNIKKEKIFVKSSPYEEIEYYRNGNRKIYTRYEKQNLVHIIENYRNGQIKAQGKKLRRNGRNDEWHGRWIWYNPDGTVSKEENFRKSKKIVLNHTKKLLTHLIYIYLYYLSCVQGGEKA